MFDVDNFTPQAADPVLEPEKAIKEWVRHALSPEFPEREFCLAAVKPRRICPRRIKGTCVVLA